MPFACEGRPTVRSLFCIHLHGLPVRSVSIPASGTQAVRKGAGCPGLLPSPCTPVQVLPCLGEGLGGLRGMESWGPWDPPFPSPLPLGA